MAMLTILRYPDKRLHKVARPVQAIDERIRKLAADMLETMYAAEGVGLAATQVDVHERLIVLDVSEERDAPMVLINPELIWSSDDRELHQEGCLSLPGIYEEIERAERIRVRAHDEHGQLQEIEADGLLAICIQHEMDHLVGKVFVDYLSALKRGRIKTRLLKSEREAHKEKQKVVL